MSTMRVPIMRVAAVAFGLCACVPTAQLRRIDHAHDEQERQLGERYKHAMGEIAQTEAKWLVKSVEPRIASAPDMESVWTYCNRSAPDRGECTKRWVFVFVERLRRRYPLADLQVVWTKAQKSGKAADYEDLARMSHNGEVQRLSNRNRKRVRDVYRNALHAVMTSRALQRSQAIRRHRVRIAKAIAAGARRFSDGIEQLQSRRSRYAPSRTVGSSIAASGECSNDFQCGIGRTCVKENYRSSGVCARAVDDFGLPTYRMPRLDSVNVKLPEESDCQFDTDCPIGFRCYAAAGACLKK